MPKENPTLNRREFIQRSAAAGTLALASQGCMHGPQPSSGQRSNILLIVTDQQHGRALGCVDNTFQTPHMDALAARGTRFSHAFCTTPQCSASRASIYTGLYPHKAGVLGNVGSVDHHGNKIPGLPEGTPTLGSRLQAAGYHTGYYGKWHLAQQAHFSTHFDSGELDSDAHGDATTNAAAFLKSRKAHPEQPFALCVNYIDPHDIYQYQNQLKKHPDKVDHSPLPTPESWSETFVDKPDIHEQFMREDQGHYIYGHPDPDWLGYRHFYREKCRLVDAEIGGVLQTLKDTGLDENTIVIVTSDHGDMETHHRLIYKGPFMYEEMIHVPLIVHVPESMGGKPDQREDLISLVDILPTLCDFAGTEAGGMDGQSLRPCLTGKGKSPQRDYIISQYYNKQKWVNPIRTIRTKTHKYNRYITHGEELYDLKEDPYEMTNMAEAPSHTKIKQQLAEALARWMEQHGDNNYETQWPTNRDGTRYKAL